MRGIFAVERSGKELVYMIPAKDYELFQKLLQEAEDQLDLQEAEQRMDDLKQERSGFEKFFQE